MVSGLYAVNIAYDVLYYTNNALTAEISWSCFLVMFSCRKLHMASKPCRSAKECIYVWLVIHYLDFDSVALYYVCSLQLEIIN